MTVREQVYLLLNNRLGDPGCKPLTLHQFNKLARALYSLPDYDVEQAPTYENLRAAGLSEELAMGVLALLDRKEQLKQYLKKAKAAGCAPLIRISRGYPFRLLQRLGEEAPAVLWAKGDPALLGRKCISVVGSRDLQIENYLFAHEVGARAAKTGFAVVSGNARGADWAAQNACITNRGFVISILPDELSKQPANRRILYLSEEGFDIPFSSYRALQRNRLIHGLGDATFVAQCANGKGGTWDGTKNNLQNKRSPVLCLDDGSSGMKALEKMGARLISRDDLAEFEQLL